jgi:hypothetical protein
MARQRCDQCDHRERLHSQELYCRRHLKWLVKRVDGELVPNEDSLQFERWQGQLCDFKRKEVMPNAGEI